VLLQAFEGLGDRASLHLYGATFGSPVSENYWQSALERYKCSGVFVHGDYENTRIGEILAGLDVVVVPSIWYENSPLTIQEAFIAGVPVITSDQGGMAELVRDGVDGLHFTLGDPKDLRRKMESLIESPCRVDELRGKIPDVPPIETQVAVLKGYYEKLLAETENRGGEPWNSRSTILS
jgi:glycosyltransferase involved in cell wall biosynthesis